jgi:hypothetical protein
MSLTINNIVGTKPLIIGGALDAGGFAALAVAADGGLTSGGAAVTALNVNQVKGTKPVLIAGQVSEGVYAVVSVNSNGSPA